MRDRCGEKGDGYRERRDKYRVINAIMCFLGDMNRIKETNTGTEES
ncbi:MAG: hypothetical protein GY782_05580 [Gammaproteobacteria bacterium]|nr:hypothetical protein [Gammaproteobacteria bacterium]